ncbi:MAG: hypothetical protein DRP64_18705, partial [Verrucomicrobia bacterium]
MERVVRQNIGGGELGKPLWTRSDLEAYHKGNHQQINFLATPHGGIKRRPPAELLGTIPPLSVGGTPAVYESTYGTFDGTSTYIETPLTTYAGMTVTIEARFPETIPTNQAFWSFRYSSCWMYRDKSDPNDVRFNNGEKFDYNELEDLMGSGEFHTIKAVIDSNGDVVEQWIDGDETGYGDETIILEGDSSGPNLLLIGMDDRTGDGQMDWFSGDMQSFKVEDSGGTILEYDFKSTDNTSTEVTDISGEGNHGTLYTDVPENFWQGQVVETPAVDDELYAPETIRGFPFIYDIDTKYALLFVEYVSSNGLERVSKCEVYSADGAKKASIDIPYSGSEFYAIDYKQINDVIMFAHGKHPSSRIVRYGDVDWRYEDLKFIGGPFLGRNIVDSTKVTASLSEWESDIQYLKDDHVLAPNSVTSDITWIGGIRAHS